MELRINRVRINRSRPVLVCELFLKGRTTLCNLVNNWKESNLPQTIYSIAFITDHAIVLIMLCNLYGFMSALEKNINDYAGISTRLQIIRFRFELRSESQRTWLILNASECWLLCHMHGYWIIQNKIYMYCGTIITWIFLLDDTIILSTQYLVCILKKKICLSGWQKAKAQHFTVSTQITRSFPGGICRY